MKLSTVSTKISKMTGRTGLLLKKNSPEILLGVGVVGIVTSTVMACKATLKVEEIMFKHSVKTDQIKECWEKVQEGEISIEEYSDTDRKKDLALTYYQTGMDFIRAYGPALLLGTISLSCIIGAHKIMRKRNIALMAAYTMVEEGFKKYRDRVIEEYGEEKDFMFKNGLRAETVSETVVDDEGKSKKVKTTKYTGDPNDVSLYARFFDESSTEWGKNPEYNLMFLRNQQNFFNDMLKVRGHVFLNEVYDALGIPRSKAGAVVGWVVGEGDSFIDFGIYDQEKFVNGKERSILLDFNVDGVIYDLI